MKLYTKLVLPAVAAIMTLAATSCSGGEKYEPMAVKDNTNALNNIYTRTSIREYTGRQIPQDTLTILLKAGMSAPTAMNKQPWKFVVVNNPDLRDKLGQAMPNVGDKVKTAGAVIVVCGDSERFITQQPEFWVQDCSAATENILLAATACNLGAVWCGVYPDTERAQTVRNVLGLPETLIPLNIIPVGYPTAIYTPKDKWNPDNILTL